MSWACSPGCIPCIVRTAVHCPCRGSQIAQSGNRRSAATRKARLRWSVWPLSLLRFLLLTSNHAPLLALAHVEGRTGTGDKIFGDCRFGVPAVPCTVPAPPLVADVSRMNATGTAERHRPPTMRCCRRLVMVLPTRPARSAPARCQCVACSLLVWTRILQTCKLYFRFMQV
jgi:hypothetical protein